MDRLSKIKEAILKIESEADCYLFGSRARGDNKIDSDWDILIIVPGEVNYRRKINIWNSIYDIEIAQNITTSIAVRSKDLWEKNNVYHETEFYNNLSKDMVKI